MTFQEACETKGFVTDAANLLGVTRVTIYNWKKGKSSPSIQQALLLDKEYNIDICTWN